jgi:hypothetical protein
METRSPISAPLPLRENVYSSTKDPEIAEWLKTGQFSPTQAHSYPPPR